MNYQYKEIADWGIIQRQWIAEEPDYRVLLEQHEENRYTVLITHRRKDLEYYSYCAYGGNRTFRSLDEAQEFAALQLVRMRTGNFENCSGAETHRDSV